MYRIEHITSLEAPDLEPYRTMRRPLEHREKGIFVVEGVKVVRRFLESDFEVVSVLIPERWLEALHSLLEARPENFPVYVAPEKELLEQLTGYSMFQGVLAVGRIPSLPSLESVVEAAPHPRLLVAVDALANAENLGALVRNCAAFGVRGFIVGETSSSPFLRRSIRNSMGTIFKMPVVETSSLAATLKDLRERFQIRSIATHPHTSAKTLARTDLSGDCCIVFGSEGYGISPAVLAACDEAVAIPMAGDVDSLNVGSAGAVFLYEVCRQRGLM